MAGSSLMLAPDAYSGRKLGKYEILCRLSTGGMSEIFLAFQKGLAGFRKFVVLKQILPDIKGEEEFVRMFLDEAKITAAFTHPNIAQVFDLDIDDGELFLAMEFVPGATLVEVARACRQLNEPIPIGFTLMAVRDTALALHYAHTFTDPMGRPQQVIHRDIAEKNIMVTYEGVTKLLDFGIAKALNRVSRTSVGMVKGTSGYMSPEQILGEPLDPRSDLFALGVVMHECLTGMRLFHGKTAEDGMIQALKSEVQPPSRLNPQVSAEIDAVALKALQRNRSDRFGTALEFARAVERASAGQIWHPEESAEFVQRLFAERRDQTRTLMSHANNVTEHTGEFKLAQFLGNEAPPPPPAATAKLPPQPVSPPPPPVEAQPPPPPVPAAPAPRQKERPSGARPSPEPITAPRTPTRDRERERRPTRAAPPVPTSEEVTNPRFSQPLPEPLQPASPPGVAQPRKPELPFDLEEPEARTIPASSIEDLVLAEERKRKAAMTTLPARPRPSRREENTLPGKPPSMRRAAEAAERDDEPRDEDRDDENDDTTSDPRSRVDVTMPGVQQGRRRGGPVVVAALGVVLLAALGGTVFALGLHEELLGGARSESSASSSPATAPGAMEPLQLAAPAVAQQVKPASAPAQEVAASATANSPAEDAPPSPDDGAAEDEADPAAVAELEVAPLQAEPSEPAKTQPAVAASAAAPAPASADEKTRTPSRRRTSTVAASGAGAKKSTGPKGGATNGEDESAADDAWAAASETRKDKAGRGTLTLVTEPFSTVYLGGKSIGETPLVKYSVPAGRHTLRLVGPDNKAVALPVQITDGEETKVRVPLSTLKPL